MFTDWRDHIELSCYRVGFLERNKIAVEFILMGNKAALSIAWENFILVESIQTKKHVGCEIIKV